MHQACVQCWYGGHNIRQPLDPMAKYAQDIRAQEVCGINRPRKGPMSVDLLYVQGSGEVEMEKTGRKSDQLY